MKKNSPFLRFLLCVFGLPFLFSSCDEEEICTYPGDSFSYETFSKYKEEWVEPSDYTFRLAYSIGDSLVGPEYITVVTDGESKCISNQCAERATLSKNAPEAHFSSISALYDYFDKIWKENPEVNTSEKYVYYSCNFKTAGGVTYPAYLNQAIGEPNADRYGGVHLQISNFSPENHKTFAQKRAAWKEPAGAYSFMYSIRYDFDKIGPYECVMKTTVDKNGNATCSPRPDGKIYQESYDSFKEKYGDVFMFGSGDDFGKFYSISEIYDLIEKIWSAEEEKQSDVYGIAPFFTSQDSQSDSKIPYDFETESIAQKDTVQAGSESEEFTYLRVTVSVRNFTLD